MTLNTLKAMFADLRDDENSCRFYKMTQIMERMTKTELLGLIRQIHEAAGRSCYYTMRMKKSEMMRSIDWLLATANA